MNKKISVGVIGASGITGGELCRLLLGHPNVEKIIPLTRKITMPFERIHKNLKGSGLEFKKYSEKGKFNFDVVFFCTPTGEAMRNAKYFLDSSIKVIDLSADFRFNTVESFEYAHQKKHMAPKLLAHAICGISELYRNRIIGAQLVANPGCYVIASVLALVPIIKSKISIADKIFITAINGTSGANSLVPELHPAQASNSMLPYNLNGHRHRLEIIERIFELTSQQINVDFSAIHGNFPRGIFLIIYISVLKKFQFSLNRDIVLRILKRYYGESPNKEFFVRINDFDRKSENKITKEYDIYPNVARVVGSNYCHIGADYDQASGTIKIISVIDNLVKGAAGSAIQNMNLMFRIDEKCGLKTYGL